MPNDSSGFSGPALSAPPGDATTIIDVARTCPTIADVLRCRAAAHPHQIAYRFLPDGDTRELTMTYAQVDARAWSIAATLRARLTARKPVLLVYAAGLEFVCAWFGCQYAGAIPVAVHPPRRSPRGAARFLADFSAIADDAGATMALTTAAILAEATVVDSAPHNRILHWLATDSLPDEPAPCEEREGIPMRADDVALLQYTSGSTATPRGVVVTQANLMHNLKAIRESFWRPTDRGSVTWLPPQHDMGLIGGILAPMYVGSPATLLPALAFVQQPRRWLEAITRYGATVSGGPNFAYELCVRRIPSERQVGLDLRSWRVAFNGAEPVRARTIEEFSARFAPCGFDPGAFTPCYGLAEATLLVSVSPDSSPPRIESFQAGALERHHVDPCERNADDARTLVSCGRPIAPMVIVAPGTSRVAPPNSVGEICVGGPSVTRGYWGHELSPDLVVRATLTTAPDGWGPLLRTGDLGFLHEGELFVTGRLKDLLIVDGANHYPQDIERTVGDCHAALEAADCAAFCVDVGDREVVVIVAGVPRGARAHEATIASAVRAAVAAEHNLRVHDVVLVKRGRVAKTASGKIRRRACRDAYLAGALDRVGRGVE